MVMTSYFLEKIYSTLIKLFHQVILAIARTNNPWKHPSIRAHGLVLQPFS